MKEKLALIRNLIEQLAAAASDPDEVEEHLETINDEMDKIEILADHIDGYDDFDIETWAEELRQLVEEMDD